MVKVSISAWFAVVRFIKAYLDQMSTIVMKFGGTSVADLARIENAAEKIAREHAAGHKCAVVVAEELGGVFPQTEEELQALPGVGAYTAAAIAAIAFDRRAIVLDGNIERIAARLFAVETPLPAAKAEGECREGS